MSEYRRFDFNSRRFKSLMLYFSQRGLDERLIIGSTKLNKLLFFTDFEAYKRLGQPLTGARYQKLQHGPAARQFVPMRDELLKDQEARYQAKSSDDLNDVLVPISAHEIQKLLSDDELRVANETFENLREFNAKAVRDYAHLRSAGWKVVDMKEDIPYESVFVLTDPPPREAIELGRRLAVQYSL